MDWNTFSNAMPCITKCGSVLVHVVSFVAACLITRSMNAPYRLRGLVDTWAGADNVILEHPVWLQRGFWLLVIGFGLQILIDFFDLWQFVANRSQTNYH